MTNEEALLIELTEDTGMLVKVIFGGMCSIQPLCSECPFGFVDCNNKDTIKEWLESEAEDRIDNAKAVEMQEVKHGRWEYRNDGRYHRTRAYCTNCGLPSGIGGIRENQAKPYCPNCGAKMDAKEDNN